MSADAVEPMTEADGLVFAVILDEKGGGREIGWSELERWTPGRGRLWIHVDYARERARAWLADNSGIDPVLQSALLAEDPRPRSLATNDGLLLVIRGVNVNTKEHPEDLVSLRLWVDEHKIVTLRHRRYLATKRLREAVRRGVGPTNAATFVVMIIEATLEGVQRVVSVLDDLVDAAEERVIDDDTSGLRRDLAHLRRQAIDIRRYIAPQRDALGRLMMEPVAFIDDHSRMRLRESADRITRMVEEIDSARERAAVTQDELSNRISERMNKTMYVLSIVAAVFLPLGLLTGLLGMDVGGIPGQKSSATFWVVCGVCLVMSVLQIYVFKKMKWL